MLLQINAANRTIMGVSQVPVWSETFEEGSVLHLNLWMTQFGQTGRGLEQSGRQPAARCRRATPSPTSLALTRNLASATSGFYLSCAVNLPGRECRATRR